MLKIIQNLEALYKGAKNYDDSEILRAIDELDKEGVSKSLQNYCLRLANSDAQIECLRSTILFELKVDQLLLN